jgi:preprotein translocase subunit SecD
VTSYTEDDLRRALAEEAVSTPPPIDVWPSLRRRVAARRWRQAGLATGLAGIVAAVLLVTLPGADTTSRLSTTAGAPVTWMPNRRLSDAQLQQAVDLLRQRLDALGVPGASVRAENGHVVVRAPKLAPPLLSGLLARGVVQFRPVLALQPPGQQSLSTADMAAPTLTAAEHTFAKAACPAGSAGRDPATSATSYLVACSGDGTTEYLLGPAALDNAQISNAQAERDLTTDEWLVEIAFTSSGASAWQSFTADAAGKPDVGNCGPPRGCNAIGMVVDGSVLSAPRVVDPGGIRGGQTEIAGGSTQQEAQLLAAQAGAAPLPTGFTPNTG